MTYAELTENQKRRFRNTKCICCLQDISQLDSFEMIEMKYKRVKLYVFAHSNCIYKLAKTTMSSTYGKLVTEDRENGKEESN